MPRKKAGGSSSLGHALIKQKRKQNATAGFGGIGPVSAPVSYTDPSSLLTIGDQSRSGPSTSSQGGDGVARAWKNLNSVTDQGDLDALLQNAVLSERTFTAEKGAVLVENSKAFEVKQLTQDELNELRERISLKVPRKPKWDKNMTVTELERNENQAFLEWRRGLARTEQENGIEITPFEKNIEIWKQFWRVVEMSDSLMQIVDARDPLFFASEDVVEYIKETGQHKRAFLLINKSDMLSLKQRIEWCKYFKAHGISFLFWSALMSQKTNHEQEKEDEKEIEKEKETTDEDTNSEIDNIVPEDRQYIADAKIRTASELLTLFHKIKTAIQKSIGEERKIVIGMVGYPNVGKSSTINAICGCKRVAVTSTPGKTKHFQTINLAPDLTLCDCPGLVFPSFVGSRADMVCNGVLSIDQMSDYVSPVVLVCQRINIDVIYEKYGLAKAKTPEDFGIAEYNEAAPKFLRTLAAKRGFWTAHGEPDMSRAARIVMKDYVSAILFFGHPPPGVSAELYEPTSISEANLVQESIENSLLQNVLNSQTTSAKVIAPKKKSRRSKKDRYQFEPGQAYGVMGANKGKGKLKIHNPPVEQNEEKNGIKTINKETTREKEKENINEKEGNENTEKQTL